MLFCKVPSIIIFGHFLKKNLGISAKSFQRLLLCFSHPWLKSFPCLQRNVWGSFSPNNEFSLFGTLEEKKFRYLADVFGKSPKTAVFVSRGKIRGLSFYREICFQHFLYLAMKIQFFVRNHQERFQKFLFSSKEIFWEQIVFF